MALAIVAALVLLPGTGFALAVAPPRRLRLESRLALAIGGGYATVLAAATLLALGHVLGRATFLAAVAAVTVGYWVVAVRRAGLRPHLSALRCELSAAPFRLWSGIAAAVVFAATRLDVSAAANLVSAGAWRYWADGLEVAAAGHVPDSTPQWGATYPPATSKIGLSSFEAGVSYLVGQPPLDPMSAILFLAAVGLFLALWAFGAELGLGSAALALPLAIMLLPGWVPLSRTMTTDLQLYKAENLGRMTAICGAIAAMAFVRHGGRLLAGGAVLLLVAAALTHLIPFAIVLALLAWWLVVWLIQHRTRREVRRALVSTLVVVTAVAAIWLAVVIAAGKSLGFEGTPPTVAGQGIPASADLSRSFSQAHLVSRRKPDGHFLYGPASIVREYVADSAGIENHRLGAAAALSILLAVSSLAVLRACRSRFVAPIVMAFGLAATLTVVALLFSYHYRTKIPGNFGLRRLYDYTAVPTALLLATSLSCLAWAASRRWPAVDIALPVALALAVAASAAFSVPASAPAPYTARSLAAFGTVSRVVPCGARILPNARTAGSFEAFTGHSTLLEGMAPYLRPSMLRPIVLQLVGARRFFAHPSRDAAYLSREHVDYVVVIRNVPIGWTAAPFPVDEAALSALPGVHEVAHDGDLSIYATGSAPPAKPADGTTIRRC
jgi:hypothetical protein